MRDRAFVGESDRRYEGSEVIGRMWNASLEESLGAAEDQNRDIAVAEIERAMLSRRGGGDLLAELRLLGLLAKAL